MRLDERGHGPIAERLGLARELGPERAARLRGEQHELPHGRRGPDVGHRARQAHERQGAGARGVGLEGDERVEQVGPGGPCGFDDRPDPAVAALAQLGELPRDGGGRPGARPDERRGPSAPVVDRRRAERSDERVEIRRRELRVPLRDRRSARARRT